MDYLLQRFFIFLLIFSFIAGQLIRLDVFGVVFPLLDASVFLFMTYAVISRQFSFEKYFKNMYLLIFIASLLISNLINFHLYSFAENLRGNLYLARFVLYSLITGIRWDGQTPTFAKTTAGRQGLVTTKIINYIGGIIALIGIFQFVFLPDLRFLQYQNWDDHLRRLTFPFLDPSFTGAILLVFLIILVVNGLKPFTIIKKAIFIAELIAILLTFSRATWVTAGIVLIIIFLNSKISIKKLVKNIGRIWIIGAIGIIGAIVLLIEGSKTLPYGNKITRIETINSRFTGISKALQIWQKNPILGVGFNHYLSYQLKNGFYVKNDVDNRGESSVENSFVFVLATSGIIGFICFVIWIWDSIRRRGLIGRYVMISVLIGSLFNNLFFYPFILLIIFVLVNRRSFGFKPQDDF